MSSKFCAFDALLFDLGGTLIYFAGDKKEVIVRANLALIESLQQLGYGLPPDAFLAEYETRLKAYFERRDQDLIETTTRRLVHELVTDFGYPDVSEQEIRTALQAMYEIFEASWLVEEDALRILQDLKAQGCRIGLVSNAADDDDVQRRVDRAGLRPYLDVIFTSAVVGVRKPHPHIFAEALSALGCTAVERVLMVGDRLNADIAGAKRLGMRAAWITRRVPRAQEKAAASSWQPDVRVDSLDQLRAWISEQSKPGR